MKTEVLFRGKRKINIEFIYCSLIVYGGRTFIYPVNGSQEDYHFYGYEVLRGTVSQYTGHLDDDGKQIFEDDICLMIWPDGTVRVDKIVKKVDYFAPDYSTQPISILKSIGITFEVIGNIFDNPELLADE